MNTDSWISIAALSGPIISAIAIVVAILISRRSSKDAQKQIDEIRRSTQKQVGALHEQIEAFRAAQVPEMLASLEQYKAQLDSLDKQIEDAQEEYEVVNPFFGLGGAPIDDITYLEDKKQQAQGLKQLKAQRKKIVNQIQLIESFLNKTK